MQFTKMHGLGNNYVLFNLLEELPDQPDWAELARLVSDVHFGIGSDGIILIGPSQEADFRMRIFNADGSEGKTCGNGLRCTAKYLFDHGYAKSRSFTLETLGGIVTVELQPEGDGHPNVGWVKVDMGIPRLLKGALPMTGDPLSTTIGESFWIGDREFQLTCLSMGNPHAILFVDDVHQFPLEHVGPMIEHADLFPERVNVGIVRVRNDRELDYRVWERGSGLTMACGSGACAAVVAATLHNQLARDEPITVHLPGGDLSIHWDRYNHVWKTGPAAYICRGQLELKTACTI